MLRRETPRFLERFLEHHGFKNTKIKVAFPMPSEIQPYELVIEDIYLFSRIKGLFYILVKEGLKWPNEVAALDEEACFNFYKTNVIDLHSANLGAIRILKLSDKDDGIKLSKKLAEEFIEIMVEGVTVLDYFTQTTQK